MRKRVLCLMLACCVFCSSVITNKKDAYAVAGVDDAFVFALAGAMVVSAGYVAYQESDSIMEAGRAMCQESAEMYDTCKRYASQAVDGAVRFGKDSLADLKSMFNAVDSVFAGGSEVELDAYSEIIEGGEIYIASGRSFSFYTREGVLSTCTLGSVNSENGRLKIFLSHPNDWGHTEEEVYIGGYFSKYFDNYCAGNYKIGLTSSRVLILPYGDDGRLHNPDNYDVDFYCCSDNYVIPTVSVACPRDESFPCDPSDVFSRWKDSISKGNDVIVRPEVGLPISNWGDIYSDDGLVSGVDLVGGSDPVIPENPDIPDYGEIGSGDIVDIPDGVIDKPIEGDGVTTGEGINGGILTGIAKLLNSILARLKALPALLGSALIGTGTLDFSKLTHSGLTTVFPFCVPFDVVDGISSLAVEGKAPRFVLSFKGTVIEEVGDIVFDFEQFEFLAKIVRYFVFIIFALGLALVTRFLIKG